MSYKKLNLAFIALALLITTALSWLQHDKLVGNTLMSIFTVFSFCLIVNKLFREKRELSAIPSPTESQPEARLTLVLLILKPYAEEWFTERNYTNSFLYSNKADWLLVNHPDMLLHYPEVLEHYAPTPLIAAFFPFLTYRHATSTIMIDQLINWQRDFSGVIFRLTLPCTLSICVQFSAKLPKNNINPARIQIRSTEAT